MKWKYMECKFTTMMVVKNAYNIYLQLYSTYAVKKSASSSPTPKIYHCILLDTYINYFVSLSAHSI